MLSVGSFQSNVKSVVLSAWKERWPIKKWTSMARRALQSGNAMDMQHMAEILFAQAFVGSSPNTVLLNYFHYSLQTNIFTYGAVLAAISRHEDLQNIASKKCILKLLDVCLSELNSGQVLEDCVSLCRSMLSLLKWLLRNIEQYLKGVQDVPSQDCNDVLNILCLVLQLLTQGLRTSALLTVARFEESSVWSHIETDLAVIKNAAGQHSLQTEVSRTCHCVSQLSRLHVTRNQPIFTTSTVDSLNEMTINVLILLENEPNHACDTESMVIQLLMITKISNISLDKLLLDSIRTCLLAYLDSVNTQDEQRWMTMLFLSLPRYLSAIKSNIALLGSDDLDKRLKNSDFETAFVSAITKLFEFDGILNALDLQNRNGEDSCEILVQRFVDFNLVKKEMLKEVMEERKKVWKKIKHDELQEKEKGPDPSRTLKAEDTANKLLKMLDVSQYPSNKEDLLMVFNKVSSSMDLFFSTARANGSISEYTKKIILMNNSAKASSAESSASALSRSVLFDLTFFMICHIAQQNGKTVVLNSGWFGNNEDVPFLLSWINTFWPSEMYSDENARPTKKLNLVPDANRVEKLLPGLQKGTDIDGQLKKWDDLCTNIPEVLHEIVKAWQAGAVSEEVALRAASATNSGVSLALCLTCVALLIKKASQVNLLVLKTFYIPVISQLLEETKSKLSTEENYKQRYKLFKQICNYLVEYFLPNFNKIKSSMPGEFIPPVRPMLVDTLKALLEKSSKGKWVSNDDLARYNDVLALGGPKWFCHQLLLHVLSQTRFNFVQQSAQLVFALFQLDVDSLVTCLLCHELPQFLTNEEEHLMFSEPAGTFLARITVATLAIALQNLNNQQSMNVSLKKSLHKRMVEKNLDNIFLNRDQPKQNGKPAKLRRLMSSTAEHDLSSNDFSAISNQHEPVLQALNYCLDVMHASLIERRPGPHTNFILQFINLSSQGGDLVSQAVLHWMPNSMVSELTTILTTSNKLKYNANTDKDFNSIQFTLAISDLGDSQGRKIAARSICQISV